MLLLCIIIRSGRYPVRQAVARIEEQMERKINVPKVPEFETKCPNNVYIMTHPVPMIPIEIIKEVEDGFVIRLYEEHTDIFLLPFPSRELLNYEIIGKGREIIYNKQNLRRSKLIRAMKVRVDNTVYIMHQLHEG